MPNLNNLIFSTISDNPKYHIDTSVASPANMKTTEANKNSFGNRFAIIYKSMVNIASKNVKLKPIKKLIRMH